MLHKVRSEPGGQWTSVFRGFLDWGSQSLRSVLLVLESVGQKDKRLRRITRRHLVNRSLCLYRKVSCFLTCLPSSPQLTLHPDWTDSAAGWGVIGNRSETQGNRIPGGTFQFLV